MADIAQSFVRGEPPCIFYGVFVGVVTPEQMREFCRAQREFADGKPHIFGLLDISRAAPITAHTRRVAAEELEGVPIFGTAMVGADFHIRVLATLAVNVVNLLGRKEKNPVRFFKTEAEARTYLAERHAELMKTTSREENDS